MPLQSPRRNRIQRLSGLPSTLIDSFQQDMTAPVTIQLCLVTNNENPVTLRARTVNGNRLRVGRSEDRAD